jgi:hypothetical protein
VPAQPDESYNKGPADPGCPVLYLSLVSGGENVVFKTKGQLKKTGKWQNL